MEKLTPAEVGELVHPGWGTAAVGSVGLLQLEPKTPHTPANIPRALRKSVESAWSEPIPPQGE